MLDYPVMFPCMKAHMAHCQSYKKNSVIACYTELPLLHLISVHILDTLLNIKYSAKSSASYLV